METNQIIRIPFKYWELFETMSNEESWKLIKALFIWKSDWLNWLTLTYFNIIMVDISNLFNSASNWKKGGRPKKEPGVINKNNQGLWKSITNTSKDKISKDKISKDNIISKDIETKVSVNKSDDKINNMQNLIKKTIENNNMIYKAWKYERPRIQNIISWKDFWDVCEKSNMSREEFVVNIINLASRLQYSKPINNWADLYYNYAEVYNKALKTKNDILQPKRQIW